jgi:hypothetical protein
LVRCVLLTHSIWRPFRALRRGVRFPGLKPWAEILLSLRDEEPSQTALIFAPFQLVVRTSSKAGSSAWINQTFRQLHNFSWQQGMRFQCGRLAVARNHSFTRASLHRYPGTSYLATISLSLRDKSRSPIEAPHNYLSAYGGEPWESGLERVVR